MTKGKVIMHQNEDCATMATTIVKRLDRMRDAVANRKCILGVEPGMNNLSDLRDFDNGLIALEHFLQ